MGLGSMIGGGLGAAGGFALSGGNPMGAMAGYSAGSALGGYAGGMFGSQHGTPGDDQAAARAQEQAYLESLRAAAEGRAPSAADAQFRVGMNRLMAQQKSIAGSQPGLSPAAAARMSAVGTAGVGQGMVSQLAAQRAQEQAVARQQYAAFLEAIRQQDIGNRGLNLQQRGQNIGIAGAGLGGLASLGSAAFSSGMFRGSSGGVGQPTGGGGDSLMTPSWA